ncbi:RHS repeat-associated core domain-containing protein [Arthrobacter bambusae]|uniref:RHS repeat-associated core domain-containing protein n=1 Tax=Arthrobacter bambusae TaxID=1338426 RepID=UPI002784A0E9|nr:RHS repeat-associated core domain-containing protein [Arthrobacter bambusae]MDQ0028492.1 RHS repeat-associated protein [Arthrobacter bambusae]MDQ0096713.1 RHS repeat-associated protein [Arthrobacter bambusae]
MILISMRTGAGSFYYTTDALGSIILLTDSTQGKAATYSYDSRGNATSTGAQAANNPWQYAGGYYEASTNRVKFGARYYNPYRGRFTQTDPSGQEANRYAYVKCNPINATDPSGLDLSFGDIVGAIVGGAVGTALDPFLSPMVGGAISGCIAGGLANALNNANPAQGCLEGGVLGGITAGIGPVIKLLK